MTSPWTEEGSREIGRIAGEHGFPEEAGLAMVAAIAAGGGSQAQFSHSALGGMGQWSQGGMLMIGDMFNDGLKGRVRSLADDLADALRSGAIAAEANRSGDEGSGMAQSSGRWWPDDLGAPASSGAQNNQRYAVFPDKRRLAIERDGRVTLHDTGDHRIGGASQQQGGTSSLSFSSQHGTVALEDLPEVRQAQAAPREASKAGSAGAAEASAGDPDPDPARPAARAGEDGGHSTGAARGAGSGASGSHDEILETIAKLADLRDRGILSEEEFGAKKADLLGRI